jgi:hypothetical protein
VDQLTALTPSGRRNPLPGERQPLADLHRSTAWQLRVGSSDESTTSIATTIATNRIRLHGTVLQDRITNGNRRVLNYFAAQHNYEYRVLSW